MENINEEKKKCRYCQQDISIKATRCPHCHGDLRSWAARHKILTGIFVCAVIIFWLGVIGSASNHTTSGTSNTYDDLKVSVQTTLKGLEITNNESADWTDCYVGVNGSTGWGFDSPPYRTRGAFWLGDTAIPAGKTIEVSYSNLVADDGTRFDINSQAVNTILVDCFHNMRSWVGSK